MVYPLAHLRAALTPHTPAAGALQGGGLNPHPHPLWISDVGAHLIHFGSGAIILFVQVLVVLSGLLNMNNSREQKKTNVITTFLHKDLKPSVKI